MNRRDYHHHHHHGKQVNRAFGLAVVLNLIFVAAEAAAGFWADSLALLTDAGHNLSDVLGLLIAWCASWLGRRETSERRTYGFSRATILASIVSALLLLTAVGAIGWEAIGRLKAPQPTQGVVLMVVAGIGVFINTATALLFVRGKDRDLNIRGAYLHMAADAAVSLGVVFIGLAIMLTGWLWLDPAISLVIGLVILLSTWGLLRDSLNLAFDAVPKHIDISAVRGFLAGLPGVSEVHDLHIWAMSTTETALTAHLVVPENIATDQFLFNINDTLSERYQIEHSTIQLEHGSRTNCKSCD